MRWEDRAAQGLSVLRFVRIVPQIGSADEAHSRQGVAPIETKAAEVRVAVDAMGGDLGPRAVVSGILDASVRYGGRYILFGKEEKIRAAAGPAGLPPGIEVVDAPEEIGMDEPPARAVREKKRSSIAMGVAAVKEGRADAFLSAGHTGAVMAASTLAWGRLQGIERPAIAAVLPSERDPVVLVDVGATVDSKPEHLLGFAILGAVFHAVRFPRSTPPRVGLLSNGTEDEKGNAATREAAALLREAPLAYVGYVEGRDIPAGRCDVVVCDGFTGNCLLKFGEGVARLLGRMTKEEIAARPIAGRIGGAILAPVFRAIRRRTDYTEFGGAPLLGLQHPAIICHGASTPKAIREAARVAIEVVVSDLVGRMRAKVEQSALAPKAPSAAVGPAGSAGVRPPGAEGSAA